MTGHDILVVIKRGLGKEPTERELVHKMTHKRKDSNHNDLAETMRYCGALVIDCTGAPELGFDAIAIRAGRVAFLEFKDGSLPPSKQRLTDHEQVMQRSITAFGGAYLVITNEQQAQEWCERIC